MLKSDGDNIAQKKQTRMADIWCRSTRWLHPCNLWHDVLLKGHFGDFEFRCSRVQQTIRNGADDSPAQLREALFSACGERFSLPWQTLRICAPRLFRDWIKTSRNQPWKKCIKKNVRPAMMAEAGIVSIQAQTILPAIPHRTADKRCTAPTPTIAPVMV